MPLNIHAEALEYLRKESLDIYNRIHSIQEDIAFVESVREAYPTLTFLPNLRCGAWYTNPAHSSNEPAYFKSTDGHYNNWGFNLRRPNLHLITVASRTNGLILVDSTRAGKRIPDALSKTVPIWCAVINRAIRLRHSHRQSEASSDQTSEMWDSALYTPPGVISPQEHMQIEGRLDKWAEELAASSYTLPDIPYPLRPLWITPATRTFPSVPLQSSSSLSSDDSVTPMYIPIICVSASRQVQEGIERRSQGFSYVQGSGDDHELWGMGLTPDLFWKHGSTLLDASRQDLEGIVRRIVTEASTSSSRGNRKNPPSRIAKVDGRILVCSIEDLPVDMSSSSMLPHDDIPSDRDTAFLIISPPPLSSQSASSSAPLPEQATNTNLTLGSRSSTPPQPKILHLYLDSGKKGQHSFLHSVLPQSLDFISSHLAQDRRQQGEEEGVYRGRDVCIACESGKDASVGVAVAALQILFDDEGRYRGAESDGLVGGRIGTETAATKQSIRRRLEWIIASRPQANPSRTTLKRVNDFLLSSQSQISMFRRTI
ncbi:initiator tRNA phosphoribosyl transferase [Stereum hirsutum FP-91666 SS1]|uniref:initiator tRNA phosphoribosyl transferase n=1 Tax=Stereum hirsutum (strain FP-91666) TaxID=721885 RepID=UPI0004449B7F|nr:initiator tRNA phosphoribosyl transferase [Stereum hirsutum FP-91666 SS1]EIM80755.1 initiator tRNA phosphoribosyl transferase [Stereum hirsutum FP-91666 SS1]